MDAGAAVNPAVFTGIIVRKLSEEASRAFEARSTRVTDGGGILCLYVRRARSISSYRDVLIAQQVVVVEALAWVVVTAFLEDLNKERLVDRVGPAELVVKLGGADVVIILLGSCVLDISKPDAS